MAGIKTLIYQAKLIISGNDIKFIVRMKEFCILGNIFPVKNWGDSPHSKCNTDTNTKPLASFFDKMEDPGQVDYASFWYVFKSKKRKCAGLDIT